MAQRAGRNDLCPCGSGKKFKKCCAHKTEASRMSRILMVVLGAAVIGAVAAAIASFNGGAQAGTGMVWDPSHGHYHDAAGRHLP